MRVYKPHICVSLNRMFEIDLSVYLKSPIGPQNRPEMSQKWEKRFFFRGFADPNPWFSQLLLTYGICEDRSICVHDAIMGACVRIVGCAVHTSTSRIAEGLSNKQVDVCEAVVTQELAKCLAPGCGSDGHPVEGFAETPDDAGWAVRPLGRVNVVLVGFTQVVGLDRRRPDGEVQLANRVVELVRR